MGYIAPEAMKGRLSPSVDLYALGAVGYFLLTGRKVFDGKSSFAEMNKHLEEQPQPIENAPPALAAIIMKCLAKRPEDRHPSASALADALEALPKFTDWDRAEARKWWNKF